MRVVLPLLVTTLMSAGCRVEPLLTVGRHCVDDSQCAEGLVCDRNNGRCARARAFDLGPDSRDALLSPDGPLVDIRVDGSSDGAARDSTADTSPGTPCCVVRVCQSSCHLFTISNLMITGLTDKDADGCRVYGDPDFTPRRLRIVMYKGGNLTTLAVYDGPDSGGQVVTFTSNLPNVTVSAQYSTSGGTSTLSELVCQ